MTRVLIMKPASEVEPGDYLMTENDRTEVVECSARYAGAILIRTVDGSFDALPSNYVAVSVELDPR